MQDGKQPGSLAPPLVAFHPHQQKRLPHLELEDGVIYSVNVDLSFRRDNEGIEVLVPAGTVFV